MSMLSDGRIAGTNHDLRTQRLRRVASVAAMAAAPWGFVVANLCYALAIPCVSG